MTVACPTAAAAEELSEPPPWRYATLWFAVLAPFFFLSYGFANWAASLRRDVPSLVFDWEHHIPFLAWTIVPYWSLDLLYALSLFVCSTRSELNTHVKRLANAQIVSVCAFLLFPLRFTFARPHADGLFGWMFDALTSFDQPFNQAPSLHLSLAAILWARYSRCWSGMGRTLIRLWLILAGVSTLTTYQHHFIDVASGLWLGLLCVALFPDDLPPRRSWTRPDSDRMKLGAMYLTGAVVLVGSAARLGGLAWWALWPAGALLIVAGIYFTGRFELFGKQNGAMAPGMAGLLLPYLAAAWVNSRIWTRKHPADEIADGVWLGRVPRKGQRDQLGFASIVDLTAELPVDTAGVRYRAVPMLDLVAPSSDQLDAAAAAIEELDRSRPTLVCCALGYSRGAAAVTAWLVASGRKSSVTEAIALVQTRRPGVVLSRTQRDRIEEWCNARVACRQ